MELKVGIVGLPNVGKSTLFNALTRSANAAAENFPFCTIEPNTGVVRVPDVRVEQLAQMMNPEKTIYSSVCFVDIAGLVAGAAKGEGLGNKFLAHIRECQLILHVLRDFESSEIHHVSGDIDPRRDWETILTELILADLESADRQIAKVAPKARSGEKEAKKILHILSTAKEVLESGKLVSEILEEENAEILKNFLTAKKYLIAANVAEMEVAKFDSSAFAAKVGIEKSIPILPICAQVESELAGLTQAESKAFLAEMGVEKSGLENLISAAFSALDLQSFLTAGPKEVRAWTIRKGTSAPAAAGEIHADFERGFIAAEVISFADFVEFGGEMGAKNAGKMRTEGKNYIVRDGDILHFRFNV